MGGLVRTFRCRCPSPILLPILQIAKKEEKNVPDTCEWDLRITLLSLNRDTYELVMLQF